MNKIKIHHFLGDSICETMDDVLKTLNQSVDGVNEFFVVHEHTMFPYLTVLHMCTAFQMRSMPV